MKIRSIILLFGIPLVVCGNVFAVSPYATTIGQNTPRKSFLTVASFPTTVADAPFIARVQNKTEGYRPYFNRSAFADLTLDEQDELEQMAYRAEVERLDDLRDNPLPVHCQNYPDDSACPNASGDTAPSSPSGTATVPPSDSGSIYPVTPLRPISPNVTQNVPYMRANLTPDNIAKYNLKTHNGGCTPPERSNHWKNTFFTSGRYERTTPAFEKFMITAFRKEGGCGSHPNDHGGYTCYGCASRGLCAGIDMKDVTRSTVEDLAYNKIYKKYNVEKLPDAFRGYLLWGMWGSGSVTGIKQFQGTLGVPRTGQIDTATIRAAETYTGDFASAYTQNREQFYRNIVARDPSQKVFLKGWLNGLQLLQPSGCHVVPTNPIYR